jgi:hypothetical protein
MISTCWVNFLLGLNWPNKKEKAFFMVKTREILRLREEMGLGLRQIARIPQIQKAKVNIDCHIQVGA